MLSLPARIVILDHVPSVGHLQVLLLVHGQKDRLWSANVVQDHLRIGVDTATECLGYFERRGFLCRAADGFRYQPTLGQQSAVAELADAYRHHPLSVIDLIFRRAC
jgi:hypothetical protein